MTDLAEEPVFNRIPLGSTGGIVADSDGEVHCISQLKLELFFPTARTIAIAATAISKDEEFGRLRIERQTEVLPPPENGIDGEFGRVGRLSECDIALIAPDIVNAIGHDTPLSVAGEVMGVDGYCLSAPVGARIVETADEFFLLGVHTDARPARLLKSDSLVVDVVELLVSVRVWVGVQSFDVALGSDLLLIQEASDGFTTQGNIFLVSEPLLYLAQTLTDPELSGLWLPCHLLLNQLIQLVGNGDIFFSVLGRPAPGRRTRSLGRPSRFSANSL